MQRDSFSKRYVIKLASSIVVVVLNVICQFMLPRALTVEDYGFYSYNLNIFMSVVVMANLSMSDAMVSKFSKKNEDFGYVKYYLIFFSIIIILLNIVIAILTQTKFANDAFGGQTVLIVLLGLNVAIVNKVFTDSVSMYDAMAMSKFPAMMNVILKVIMSLVITVGYFTGLLNLHFFYVFTIIMTAVIVVIMIATLLKIQKSIEGDCSEEGYRYYLRTFHKFCKPLVIATIISKFVVIIMNWALMNWSGATAQAMFGAAWQLSTLITYVFSPFVELLKREFAVIVEDKEQLRYRFCQSLQIVIWLVSFFAIFIAVTADWVLPMVFGEKYNDAIWVTRIIMIYTIYTAWGQINGSFLLACERTKVNATFTVLEQLFTLALVFLFQIPNFIWPDSLGSLGIVLNYLIVNVVFVTIKTIYNAKYLGGNGFKETSAIIPAVAICSIIAMLCRILVGSVIGANTVSVLLVKILVSGVLYTLALGAVLWFNPGFIGGNRELIVQTMKKITRKGNKE